ncbi:hypothetical protein [Azorhizobium sp. AG788]|uniref:hypothetical protein n=1 Tax=Azorhizobium sp. AG788 TaxID=2183897 RepID=UPI001060A6D3|nr:hypothetical protein [Azorhizobium sp. AG788]
MVTTIVEVPSNFDGVVERSVLRLEARFPAIRFERRPQGIFVSGAVDEAAILGLRSAVLHTLYRERIYLETLPMREALLSAVMR